MLAVIADLDGVISLHFPIHFGRLLVLILANRITICTAD